MKKRAMVLMKEWRSTQPNPTLEWVILELERMGIRKLNGHSASLSDELKARKEVAEVSILDCLFFLNIRSSLILVSSSGQKSISDCKRRNILQLPSKRWYRWGNNQACTPPSPNSTYLSELQPKQEDWAVHEYPHPAEGEWSYWWRALRSSNLMDFQKEWTGKTQNWKHYWNSKFI